eukprot:g13140.t1
MTLIDAAASTAFATRSPPSSSAARGGGSSPSAATRLSRMDPTPPPDWKEGSRRPIPLFSFGAIADVQYADQEDGWNFKKDYRRYYRGGLVKLRGAVDWWLREETHRFALQLGDVIDGANKRNGHSEAALSSVKAEVDRLAASLPLGVLSSLGNHELYNFPKQRWAKELDCSNRAKAVALRPSDSADSGASDNCQDLEANLHAPSGASSPPESGQVLNVAVAGREAGEGDENAEECFYYSFCPDETHRFIALDSYDVNAILQEPGPGEVKAQAVDEEGGRANGDTGDAGDGGMEVLSKHNPNRNKNNAEGMDGLNKRFVQYNGGVGKKQLLWLEGELAAASRAGQRVIGFGHVPIHPAVPSPHTLLWNYQEVLEVMHKFDCVSLFLSGHRHRETYFEDAKGIHHVSLAAALEAPPDEDAFASIYVYPDRLELRGHGVVQSRTLSRRSWPLPVLELVVILRAAKRTEGSSKQESLRKPRICALHDWTKQPSSGKAGGKPKDCRDHAEDGIVDVRRMKCAYQGCTKQASYGKAGGRPEYCGDHAEDGMVDVKNKKRAQHEAAVIQQGWQQGGVLRRRRTPGTSAALLHEPTGEGEGKESASGQSQSFGTRVPVGGDAPVPVACKQETRGHEDALWVEVVYFARRAFLK